VTSEPVDAQWQPVEADDLNDWSEQRDQPADHAELAGAVDDAEPADNTEPAEGQFDAPELPEPPHTGEPGVDEALTRLASVTGATLEEQLPVLESVHRTLQDRLADVDG